MEPAPPPPPYVRLALALFSSVILGFSIGVFFYRHWMRGQRALSSPGFNAGGPAPGYTRPVPAIPEDQAPAPSSLEMIRTGPMGAELPGPGGRPAQTLILLIRKHESRYEALAREYTRKYPVIREYGRDWAGYPDLQRFNLEYLRDRDPIKFAYGVAGSPSFAALVKKYAGRPEIMRFIADAVKATPAELLDASRSFLSRDGRALDLLSRFARAAGLPDAMVAQLAAGKGDPNKAAASILKTDPKLREFLQQGSVAPNQLNSDFQK